VNALSEPGSAESPLVAELICYGAQSCPFVRSIQSRASFLDPGTLSLGFTLLGNLDQLVIPPPGPSVRTGELWEHTCFEAFLAPEGKESYHEVNLSPSTAWATYAYSRYREGGLADRELEPRMVVHLRPDRLELHALLGLDKTVALNRRQHLRLGLSAVIEQKDGSLSYWAIKHAEGRPDFHHPVSFAMELATP
jgi:hypothetical protein